MKYNSIALLFPGQGAQYPGMGKDLYEAHAIIRETFEEGDEVLGRSLSKIILNGPQEELTKTINSQPAIYLLSLAMTRLLKQQLPALAPKFAAGLSLGEYTAVATSGYLNEWEALKIVETRGKLMAEACEQHPGTMAAILGLSQKEVEALVKESNLPHDLWAANFNSPGQTVISGTLKGVERGSELAREKGAKKVIPLTVHGAFHSGLMKSAQDRLEETIFAATFKEGKNPVVMNASAAIPASLDEMKRGLVLQVTHSVRWQESMEKLDQEGVDLFIEIGCGKTLSALNKRMGVKASTLTFEKLDDLELIAKELS